VERGPRALKVLGVGGRGRSTWNVYDIRGVVEEVLAPGTSSPHPGCSRN